MAKVNKPTKAALWSSAKSQAKAKFDVYPSAYANAWAAKKYKSMGGTWKTVSTKKAAKEKQFMTAQKKSSERKKEIEKDLKNKDSLYKDEYKKNLRKKK